MASSTDSTPTPPQAPPPPPPYSLSPSLPTEEPTLGFWGESNLSKNNFDSASELDSDVDIEITTSPYRRNPRPRYVRMYDFCCFWCAASIYVITGFAMLAALYLLVGSVGLGMVQGDSGKWSGRGMEKDGVEFHFCLSSPNRAAPGPQTWILSTPERKCQTESLKMWVGKGESWKVRMDDLFVLGEEEVERIMGSQEGEEEGRVMGNGGLSVEEKIGIRELGARILGG